MLAHLQPSFRRVASCRQPRGQKIKLLVSLPSLCSASGTVADSFHLLSGSWSSAASRGRAQQLPFPRWAGRASSATRDSLRTPAIPTVALHSRLPLDLLLAKEGSTCATIGRQCCTYIPDSSEDVSDVIPKHRLTRSERLGKNFTESLLHSSRGLFITPC